MPSSPDHDDHVCRLTLGAEGPLLVAGPVEVTLDDGTVARSDRFTVAICTCRRTAISPWCDTSHRRRAAPTPRTTIDETGAGT